MRIIASVQGISAMRCFPEDYMPSMPPPFRDIHSAIVSRYQFAAFPQLAAAATAAGDGGLLEFRAGKYPDPENGFGINRLILAPDNDVAFTYATDQSDLVLADIGSFLDETFGYRITISRKPVMHVSIVVVEFEDSFENLIKPLSIIGTIIQNSLRSEDTIKLRKFSFGTTQSWEIIGEQQQASIDTLEKVEFSIEQRKNYPYSENRYYCVAPLSTSDHIKCLEEIESVLRG